jgi:hypothetical protein
MPIVPFSKLEGVFRTGNLSSDNLEKKLGKFICSHTRLFPSKF